MLYQYVLLPSRDCRQETVRLAGAFDASLGLGADRARQELCVPGVAGPAFNGTNTNAQGMMRARLDAGLAPSNGRETGDAR